MKPSKPRQFLRQHSLSLSALAVVIVLIALYSRSDPAIHLGAFYGNAIADWSGVVVTVVMTKYLYEKGSAESKRPVPDLLAQPWRFFREHSLTLFSPGDGLRLGARL